MKKNLCTLIFTFITFILTTSTFAKRLDCNSGGTYDPNILCEGEFVASSIADVNLYNQTYGLNNGRYQNLVMNFDFDGALLEAHSPCTINFRKEITVVGDLCLDGRKGIIVDKNLTLSGGDVHFISETGPIQLKKNVTAIANDFIIDAAGNVDIDKDAIINVNNLSISSDGNIRIDQNADIDAQNLNIDVQGDVTFGMNTTVDTTVLVVNGVNCDTSNATITTIIQDGTCFFAGPNQLPVISVSATPESGEFPLTVAFDFTGSSDPDGTIVFYEILLPSGERISGTNSSIDYLFNSVGSFNVIASVTDNRGGVTSQSIVIDSLDTTSPVLDFSPNSGVQFLNDPNITFNIDITDLSAIDFTSLALTLNSTPIQANLIEISGNTITITLNETQNLSVGSNNVTATISDIFGNSVTESSIYNLVDTLAPEVAFNPISGTSFNDIPLQSFTATLTDNLSGVDFSSLEVKFNGIILSESEYTVSGNTVSLNRELAYGANTIIIGISDISGNSTNEIASYTLNDTIAPILTFDPVSGTSFGAENITITVLVDDLSGVDPTSIIVNLNSAQVPSAQIQVVGKDVKINFNSLYEFPLGENTIDISLTDLAGNGASASAQYTQNDFRAPVVTTDTAVGTVFRQVNPLLVFSYDDESEVDLASLSIFLNGEEIPQENIEIEVLSQKIRLQLSHEYSFIEGLINTVAVSLSDEFGNEDTTIFNYNLNLGPRIIFQPGLGRYDFNIPTEINILISDFYDLDLNAINLSFNGTKISLPNANVEILTGSDLRTATVKMIFDETFFLVKNRRNTVSLSILNNQGQKGFAESYYDVDLSTLVVFHPEPEDIKPRANILRSTYLIPIGIELRDPDGVNYNTLQVKVNGIDVPVANLQVSELENLATINFDENFQLIEGQNNTFNVEYQNVDGELRKDQRVYMVESDFDGPIVSFQGPESGIIDLEVVDSIVAYIYDEGFVNPATIEVDYIDVNDVVTTIPATNLQFDATSSILRIILDDIFSIPTGQVARFNARATDDLGNPGAGFAFYIPIGGEEAFDFDPTGPAIDSNTPLISITKKTGFADVDYSTLSVLLNGRELAEEIVQVEPLNDLIKLNFSDENALKSGFINEIIVVARTQTGDFAFGRERYAAPKLPPSEDEQAPSVVIFPADGSIFTQKDLSARLTFLDQSEVDYDRLEIKLNGAIVPETKYTIDGFSNNVEVDLSGNFALKDGFNALVVDYGDVLGNTGTASALYQVVPEIIPDGEGPIVNFDPNGGTIDTLTPTILISFGDESEINYESLNIKLNDTIIPEEFYTVDETTNRVTLNLNGNFSLLESDFNFLEVQIVDIGNQLGYGKLGLDTRTFTGGGSIEIVNILYESLRQRNCVVLSNGNGKCWGRAPRGETGIGSTETIGDNETPASAPEIDFDRDIKKISAGSFNTCAILVDGAVKCWGDSRFVGFVVPSSFGAGVGDEPGEMSQLPDLILGEPVIDIAAAEQGTCALTETGKVLCWGNNSSGILGTGGFDFIGDDPGEMPPSPAIIGADVTKLFNASAYICGLTTSGGLRCWGSQQSFPGLFGHKLNNRVGARGTTPSQYGDVPVGGEVLTFAGTSLSACATVKDQGLKCWGRGDFGRNGYGNTENLGDDEDISTIGYIDLGGKQAVQMAILSQLNTCALLEDGEIKCWGANINGRLASGTNDPTAHVGDQPGEMPPQSVNVGGKSLHLGVNQDGFCATRDDQSFRCWGASGGSILGLVGTDGVMGDEADELPLPAVDVGELLLVEDTTTGTGSTALFEIDVDRGEPPLLVTFNTMAPNAVSYDWDFDDGSTLTTTNPIVTHTYNEVEVYVPKLTITNGDGSQETFSRVINIIQENILPTPILTFDPKVGAAPLAVSFNGMLSFDANGSIEEYTWDFGNGETRTTTDFLTDYTYTVEGDYLVTLTVTDNKGASVTSAPQVISVGVNTAIIGRVLDANDAENGAITPLANVVVSILGTSKITTTDANGNFRLDGVPDANNTVIDFNTSQVDSSFIYAGFRESIPLTEGIDNIFTRPFFLPRIETDTTTPVDPLETTIVRNDRLGIILEVQPNSARNADGSVFTGDFTISQVPVALAPATLPRALRPEVLITVQPVGVFFDPPAKISYANTTGFLPGQEVPLTQIDPYSGQFYEIGLGRVTADGARIETIEGGVRVSSWGGPTIQPVLDTLASLFGGNDNQSEESVSCQGACQKSIQPGGSDVDLNSGKLIVTHNTVGYRTFNQQNSLSFRYNHTRANIVPVVTKSYVVPAFAVGGRFAIQGVLNGFIPNDTCEVDGEVLRCFPLPIPATARRFATINSIEAGFIISNPGKTFTQGTYLEANDFTTGVYPYEFSFTNAVESANPNVSGLASASTFSRGELVIVNEKQSPFGAGWSLAGIDRIYKQDDEDLLYVSGSGGELIYSIAQERQGLRMRMFDTTNITDDFAELVYSEFAGLGSTQMGVLRRNSEDELFYEAFNEYYVANIDFVRSQRNRALHRGSNAANDTFGNLAPQGDDFVVIPTGDIDIEPANITTDFLQETADIKSIASYGLIYEGYMKIPTGGDVTYKITRTPYHSAKLVVNGETILEVSGTEGTLNGGLVENTAIATNLSAGFVSIKLVYGTQTDDRLFRMTASGGGLPDFGGHPIPANFFFRSPIDDTAKISYVSSAGLFDRILKNEDGSYTRILQNKDKIEFNVQGLMTSRTDLRGNTTNYYYDAQGRLEEVRDSLNRSTQMIYLGNNLEQVIDPAGKVTQFFYDGNNNLVRIVDPDNSERIFSYDSDNRMISQTSKRGFVTQYKYDYLSKLKETIKPGNASRKIKGYLGLTIPDLATGVGTSANPNPNMFLDSELYAELTDPRGNTQKYKMTQKGFVREFINGKGESRKYEHNRQNLPVVITDNKGNKSYIEYDGNGNKTFVKDAYGNVQFKAEYESNFNKVKKVTDARGLIVEYSYNNYGDLTQIVDNTGRTSSFTYGSRGQILSQTNAAGETTTMTYDTNLNLKTVTDHLGNTTTFTYDSAGNLASTKDANNQISTFTYDDMNRLVSSTDARNAVTTFAYDDDGKLQSVTDGSNNVTSYIYDNRGNVISVTDPRGRVETYTYDLSENLTGQITKKGDPISYTYDEANRLTQKLGAQDVEYDYDSNGNLSYIGNGVSQIEFFYNAKDELIQVRNKGFAPEALLEQEFNERGERTELITPVGSYTYNYNVRGELENLTNPSSKTFGFAYDVLSRRQSMSYPNGLVTNYGFDTAGRLTSIDHGVSSFGYTLDNVGNRTAVNQVRAVSNATASLSYTYDQINQLVQATAPTTGTANENFSYDATGNRTTGTTITTGNRLAEDPDFIYSYDDNGNMISKVNKSNSEVTNYTFDIENKLVAITSPVKTIEYIYDGLNRRIGKVVNGIKTSYIYDGDDIIFEFGDSDQLVRTYTHGAGVDEHLSVHTQSTNQELYYHSDGLGSVTELTDQTGQVVESYLYSAFGEMKAYNSAGTEIAIDNVNQPYGYTGRELDKETDLYYYRARYYSSSAGRFVSEDPIDFNSNVFNLYGYGLNNPMTYRDPSGLGPLTALAVLGICEIGLTTYDTINSAYKNIQRAERYAELVKERNDATFKDIDSRSRVKRPGDNKQCKKTTKSLEEIDAEIKKVRAELASSGATGALSSLGAQAFCLAASGAAFFTPTP